MYIVYNRREKENKMRGAIRKRNLTTREKIRNEKKVKTRVSISTKAPKLMFDQINSCNSFEFIALKKLNIWKIAMSLYFD